MRTRRLGALITVAVTVGAMLAIAGGAPAGADPLSTQPFAGYATGTQVSTNVLQIGQTQVANVQEAFAGASVDSQGLATPITNEMGQAVQPPLPGKNSSGRGTGLELGLVTGFPDTTDVNQVIAAGLAQAAAPPASADSKQINVDLPPVVFAGLLTGQASAVWNDRFCPIGLPISYGRGEAANVQLLPTGPGGPGGLINTGTTPADNAAKTRSFEYLQPNGDGTFGLVSETHQTLVPIGIGTPIAGIYPLRIVVDGDFIMRLIARGKPATAAVGPIGSGAAIEFSDPILTIEAAGVPVPGLSGIHLSSLLGTSGINVPLPPIVDISVGGSPRAIGSDAGPPAPPEIAPDGTSVAAAYDLLQLGLLDGLLGLTGVDLRVGHMEGDVSVPAGGIKCDIPVAKVASQDPVQAGNDVTISIRIPPDVQTGLELLGCDLINIRATSTEEVLDGNVRYEIVSADHGGRIEGNVITWDNVGNYHPGDPPIVLSFVLRIPANSGAGTLQDIARVDASLGNCTGGIAGQDLIGTATLDGQAVTGTATLSGPKVGRGNLAATGEDRSYLVLGGAMLFGAIALMGVRRRFRTAPPPSSTQS